MEIKGKLFEILPAQKGTSQKGEWKKQDFIIETEEQFPKKICISNWNDKVDLTKVSKGASLTLSVNIESREFNNKWYTDIKVWKMEFPSVTDEAKINEAERFSFAPPPPTADDMVWSSQEENDDDLPF